MALTLFVLRPSEDRTKRLWAEETEAGLLEWLRSYHLPGLHNLDGIRLEISQSYRIPRPASDYNFVVQYRLPREEPFRPWSRYTTFWLDEVEVAEAPEVSEGHTLPVSLGSLIAS